MDAGGLSNQGVFLCSAQAVEGGAGGTNAEQVRVFERTFRGGADEAR